LLEGLAAFLEPAMSIIRAATARVLAVRPLETRDLPRVLRIARVSPGPRWLWDDLVIDPRSPDNGLWVAAIQEHVVGFLAYHILPEPAVDPDLTQLMHQRAGAASFFPRWFDMLHVAVAPEWRRRGIGRLLVERFDPHPRQAPTVVQVRVPESHLPLQLLLREVGYRATRVLRQYYVGEDAYLMEKRLN
jgi:ribosomal protein S18 acetylase RimI-like enzyme